MSMYPVAGIDSDVNGFVEFTSDQLKHCAYAREMYTMHDGGDWVEATDPLSVPNMTVAELRLLQQFLAVRVRVGEPPRIRDTPPIIYDCEIMYKGEAGTGLNTVIYPAVIDMNTMKEWTSALIGIHQEYMEFLQTLVRSESSEGIDYTATTISPDEGAIITRWIDYADFMGCDDMLYLLRARTAYIYKKYIHAHMALHKVSSGENMPTHKQRIERYLALDSDIQYTDRERAFIKSIHEFNKRHPMAIAGILRQFVMPRGIPLPHPEWTDEQWADFMEKAPAFYASLPVSEKDRQRLYVVRRV
jgi:hypothetical protein